MWNDNKTKTKIIVALVLLVGVGAATYAVMGENNDSITGEESLAVPNGDAGVASNNDDAKESKAEPKGVSEKSLPASVENTDNDGEISYGGISYGSMITNDAPRGGTTMLFGGELTVETQEETSNNDTVAVNSVQVVSVSSDGAVERIELAIDENGRIQKAIQNDEEAKEQDKEKTNETPKHDESEEIAKAETEKVNDDSAVNGVTIEDNDEIVDDEGNKDDSETINDGGNDNETATDSDGKKEESNKESQSNEITGKEDSTATNGLVNDTNISVDIKERNALKENEKSGQQAKEEAEKQASKETEQQIEGETEQQTNDEKERKTKEEEERKAREEAVKQAREDAERQAREEAEQKAREEADKQAKEESERKAREEAERLAREEAEKKRELENIGNVSYVPINDYPWQNVCPSQADTFLTTVNTPNGVRKLGGYVCECVSYAAWKVYSNYGVLANWGNANTWDDNARTAGYTINHTPEAGAVGQTDDGYYGHVFWVEHVNKDGSIVISDYNDWQSTKAYSGNGHGWDYGLMTIPARYASQYNYIHFR